MQLRINKSQRKAVVSQKIVFTLGARADLTAQEQEYVKKYNLGKLMVYSKERVNMEGNNPESFTGMLRIFSAIALRLQISVNDLINGRTIECKDIHEMIDAEITIKVACADLKSMLDACAGFEGEEIIDY